MNYWKSRDKGENKNHNVGLSQQRQLPEDAMNYQMPTTSWPQRLQCPASSPTT